MRLQRTMSLGGVFVSSEQKTKSPATDLTWALFLPTDEKGIGVKVYESVLLTVEVVILLVRMSIAWVYSLYEALVPAEPKSVQGEIILITGTGHGMGREMALQYSSLGATVVCVDINPKGNQETVDAITANKQKAYRYECDVTDRESVMAMAAKVLKEVGEVTVLVNNAGIMPCKPIQDQTETEVRKMFDVNIIAHVWLVQAFLPAMKERNHGHIVAMSSMAGLLGLRNLVPYCASKFAVRGFMEALHEELREDPRDFSGIKLTCVYPYIVDTGLCKNPKIKFPSMMGVVSPKQAAEHIINAMRRNHLETSIPTALYYVNKICRAVPYRIPILMKDFLDSGLESHQD